MKNWMADMLHIGENSTCEKVIFGQIEVAAKSLGFENCAYGFQTPFSFTSPKVVLINNYPVAWQKRYADAGYLHIDPSVKFGRQSLKPLVWTDEIFASAKTMWDEAKSFGIAVGWAQSCHGPRSAAGMLTLSRSCDPIKATEIAHHDHMMRWLVNVSHLSMSRAIQHKQASALPCLSLRELEVLKWTADGKSADDISEILILSKATVDFHIKNAVGKLQAPNKTTATVRAAMLGLLN